MLPLHSYRTLKLYHFRITNIRKIFEMRIYFLILFFMAVGAPVYAEVFPLTFEVPPTPVATFGDPINQSGHDGPATYQQPKSLKQPPRLRSKHPLFSQPRF